MSSFLGALSLALGVIIQVVTLYDKVIELRNKLKK